MGNPPPPESQVASAPPPKTQNNGGERTVKDTRTETEKRDQTAFEEAGKKLGSQYGDHINEQRGTLNPTGQGAAEATPEEQQAVAGEVQGTPTGIPGFDRETVERAAEMLSDLANASGVEHADQIIKTMLNSLKAKFGIEGGEGGEDADGDGSPDGTGENGDNETEDNLEGNAAGNNGPGGDNDHDNDDQICSGDDTQDEGAAATAHGQRGDNPTVLGQNNNNGDGNNEVLSANPTAPTTNPDVAPAGLNARVDDNGRLIIQPPAATVEQTETTGAERPSSGSTTPPPAGTVTRASSAAPPTDAPAAPAAEAALEAVPEVAQPVGTGDQQLQQVLQQMVRDGWIQDRDGDGRFENTGKFRDQTAKDNFSNNLNSFLARPDVSPAEKAAALQSTLNVLNMKDGMAGQGHREMLASGNLENMAKWNANDQGASNRCNVYEIASASNYLRPQLSAQRLENYVQDGTWDIPPTSTGPAQKVDMKDILQRQATAYANGGNYGDGSRMVGQSGNKGDTNAASELDTVGLAKLFNQQRGLIYSVGDRTQDNPTGERLDYIARDNQGRYLVNADGSYARGANKSTGSPDMTAADVADLAESEELGIGDLVTTTAGTTWNSGRETGNLTRIRPDAQGGRDDMAAVAAEAQKHAKYYVIMHVAGNDKAVASAGATQHANAGGGHAGHSIGMAWSRDHNINDRVNGKDNKGGEWVGNNTWGKGNDDIWDGNIVSDDGSLKLDNLVGAQDMSKTRGGGGGSNPYQNWHDSHPGSDNGTNQKTDDLQSNKDREDHKKQEEENAKKKAEEDAKKGKEGNENDQANNGKRDRALASLNAIRNMLAAQEARAKASRAAGAEDASLQQAKVDVLTSEEDSLYRGLSGLV